MPRQPPPVLFAVGPEVDGSRLGRWAAGAVPSGPGRVVDRTLLDTFDGLLHGKGLVLWLERRTGAGALVLEGGGEATLPVHLDGRSPLPAAALPPGVLGDRLRAVVGERALLPRLRVRSREIPFAVLNGDGKTVVRLALHEPVLVRRGEPPLPIDRRLEVRSVLGYGRDMQRVVAALQRRLEPAPAGVAAAALAAAGLPPGGVSSAVDVALKPGMRADRAMSGICRRLADVVDANLPGTLADIDTEFLHDLRVAVRRSRSVLKEMKDVLPPESAATARADLKWIQEITGPTRDLDVLLSEWPSMTAPVPPAMAADLRPLEDLLRAERGRELAAMRRHLRSRRFAAAWAGWRTTVDRNTFDGPAAASPIGDLAGGRIVAVYRSMTRSGRAIDDDSPPEALHDLRKRGKELRYLLELFGGIWPAERVKPLVSALKGLQDVLGHFQDDEIQVRELRSLGPAVAAAPGGTDSLIALGFVIEELTRRQQRSREDFAARFADFAGAANRRIVEGTFR
jgi:CHAD domain-containing protein